ncbi:MAG: hypothetical protein H6740_06590 [Alphaproteobacteria bacterium]|nr:hypothetical protein [Alphaproteobacteria bacterium]
MNATPLSHAALLDASQRWWRATRDDPARLNAWLLSQHRGEATAADRITELRDAWAAPDSKAWRVLSLIVEQERTHAVWVAELLAARGLPVEIEEKAERYWPALMEVIEDLETGCAVGAHAEEMRLRRIEAIAGDPEAPADVRACFQRILPEERFHARAFAKLAGETALDKTNGAHEAGLRALGLVA